MNGQCGRRSPVAAKAFKKDRRILRDNAGGVVPAAARPVDGEQENIMNNSRILIRKPFPARQVMVGQGLFVVLALVFIIGVGTAEAVGAGHPISKLPGNGDNPGEPKSG